MFTQHFQNRFMALVVGLVLLLIVTGARADPPARVARLGYSSGLVSFLPLGQVNWVQATLNRPLTHGDSLWTDAHSRAELQIGGAELRLGASTNLMITRLDDNIAQLELSQGSLKVRVRHIGFDQSLEVDTPNLSFSLNQTGDYRIDVDANGAATAVKVSVGRAAVDGEGASYTVAAGQGYRFYGKALSDFEVIPSGPDDDLDRWSQERDVRVANSNSAHYVSDDVVGYEDLDAYGAWRVDPSYGNVWMPTQIQADWTPYRNGHWTWIDPWGWSWVDDAPWGYAVSHYGRWAYVNGFWGWVPGPRHEQAVFAPALVVFLGGGTFQGARPGDGGDGAIGWFPLAPREVYLPAYQVSHGYFERVNRSNAVIAPITLVNVYQTHVTNIINKVTTLPNVVYVNQRVAGAVVAMPTRAFTHSQSVTKTELGPSNEIVRRGDRMNIAAIAPTPQSLKGGAPEARVKPPTLERRNYVREAVPAHASAVAAQPAQVHAPEESSPNEHKAEAAKATPVLVNNAAAPPVKSVPHTADSARKSASQIPALHVDGDTAKAASANRDRDAIAKAEVDRAKAARSATGKAVEPASAPHTRASEPRSMHKQTREIQ